MSVQDTIDAAILASSAPDFMKNRPTFVRKFRRSVSLTVQFCVFQNHFASTYLYFVTVFWIYSSISSSVKNAAKKSESLSVVLKSGRIK